MRRYSCPTAGASATAALGGPETYLLAGDHETSGVCSGFVLRRADEFLLGSDAAPGTKIGCGHGRKGRGGPERPRGRTARA